MYIAQRLWCNKYLIHKIALGMSSLTWIISSAGISLLPSVFFGVLGHVTNGFRGKYNNLIFFYTIDSKIIRILAIDTDTEYYNCDFLIQRTSKPVNRLTFLKTSFIN